MKFPILASVLVLCGIIAFSTHRQKDSQEKEKAEFWEKERKANSVRRKSLDNLDYISVPIDDFPTSKHTDNIRISEYIETIKNICDKPIVNLTGISNTDLKLEYGAPNIELLSLYDSRYTTLVGTIQKWAKELYDLGEYDDAKTLLEFSISTKTDVSGTYKLLADIYKRENNIDKIKALIPIAESINSPLKESIINYLNACCS